MASTQTLDKWALGKMSESLLLISQPLLPLLLCWLADGQSTGSGSQDRKMINILSLLLEVLLEELQSSNSRPFSAFHTPTSAFTDAVNTKPALY